MVNIAAALSCYMELWSKLYRHNWGFLSSRKISLKSTVSSSTGLAARRRINTTRHATALCAAEYLLIG